MFHHGDEDLSLQADVEASANNLVPVSSFVFRPYSRAVALGLTVFFPTRPPRLLCLRLSLLATLSVLVIRLRIACSFLASAVPMCGSPGGCPVLCIVLARKLGV